MSEARARFPWGLTLAVIPALVLLLSLGAWQVQRLHWKEGLIAEARRAATVPAGAPAAVLGSANPEFMKVSLTCPGLAGAPFIELQTIHDADPGVRLISVCRHPGYEQALLVDRGFVSGSLSARPAEQADATPVEIVAEVRLTPPPGAMAPPPEGRHFYARDNVAMARVLGVQGPVSPWTFYALNASNPDWPALQPSAPPAAFSNNHLGYAMTWFGLAIVLVGFYIAMLRRRPRAPTPAGDTGKSST
ncbi:MAG: SURF1 family cytochrome oxidase biogenesis protein [Brevundimonas sp.]|nr:SURF1 family cytochrome oxidase biogenesis protein [Brevundimonas sp.]